MQFRYYFLLSVLSVTLIFSCGKDDDGGCLGCGIDTSIKEYEFRINGQILENCSGKPAANRTIEFTQFYREDSMAITAVTNTTGHFSLTYKMMLPGYYWQSAKWESYFLLRVVEDSVTFFQRSIGSHSNIVLQVGDSLDISLVSSPGNYPLKETDTIYYGFQSAIISREPYPFKIDGPLDDQGLIGSIRDKWRLVQLDDNDHPVFKFNIDLRHGDGTHAVYGYTPIVPKESCVMGHQDIYILFNH